MTITFDANAYLRQFQDQEHGLVMLDRALGIFRKYLPDLVKERAATGGPSLREVISLGGTSFPRLHPPPKDFTPGQAKPSTKVLTPEQLEEKKRKRMEHHELMQKQAHECAIRKKQRRIAAHELRVKEQMEAKAKRVAKKNLSIAKREAAKLKSPRSKAPRRVQLDSEFRSQRDLCVGTVEKLVETYREKKYSFMPSRVTSDRNSVRQVLDVAQTFLAKLPVMAAYKSHTKRVGPALISQAKFKIMVNGIVDTSASEDCMTVYTALRNIANLYDAYNRKFAELFWETGRGLKKDTIKAQKKTLNNSN
jgi:hypothetical protein